MDIDFGLSITFDGKYYGLLCPGHDIEYPIGGLICEYCSLSPRDIKKVILKCSKLRERVTVDNTASIIVEFHNKLFEYFPPVLSTMIALEFQNALMDWNKAISENCVEKFLNEHFKSVADDNISTFILEDTPYKEYGCDTVLQMMLSAYYSFAINFINVKYIFDNIFDDSCDSEFINKFMKFYSELIKFQHIDYRIVSLEDVGLIPMYTIKSSVSLLLFETAHIIQNHKILVQCVNCGRTFSPEGRSDAIYCSYPSPQNANKSCKEIGAQIARANKEKTDIVTGSYRKAYMRYKMMIKRHPYDRNKRKKFDELTEGMKSWRIKLKEGSATADEFIQWINEFK